MVLDAFDNITILTYRFRNSLLQGYLQFHGRQYIHKAVVRDPAGNYLVDFDPSIEKGPQYRDKIRICQDFDLNAIGTKVKGTENNPLSATWYRNHKKDFPGLKSNLRKYYRRTAGEDKRVMWTAPKSAEKHLGPKGYIQRADGTTTFVHSTCSATENYQDSLFLAYVLDKYIHPGIKRFLGMRNIHIDESQYALSEMLQWIFRSAIRKGETINLYVPSRRMRNLLTDWLCLDRQVELPMVIPEKAKKATWTEPRPKL